MESRDEGGDEVMGGKGRKMNERGAGGGGQQENNRRREGKIGKKRTSVWIMEMQVPR